MQKRFTGRIFLVTSVTVLLLAIAAVCVGCAVLNNPVYHAPITDHFDGEYFYNPQGDEMSESRDALHWFLNRDRGYWRDWTDITRAAPPPDRVEDGELRVTFVNHSTVLIQIDGINILTDPIWSQRSSPMSWVGPRRRMPPGLRFEDLPPIDVVLISHNHYDHLDLPTARRLHEKHRPLFLVPLGNRLLFYENGIKDVVELDWWQTVEVKGRLPVTFVPARHFSGRGITDRNKTLWGGYVVNAQAGRIYFAGDTGFGSHFAEIKERFESFLLAIIPIGSFRPEWFMSPIHISPVDAVRVHQIMGPKASMAIHFGTFPLADDGELEPVERLNQLLREQSIPSDRFFIPENGDIFFPLRDDNHY
ncbi:MAG: MBL fold metallo-hydrolase [Proteobacteria bacterium]|nr:MBL fold metallo-hydrolase [Pseudomonadota bacterium]